MQRSLKTPVRAAFAAYAPHNPWPYLQLDSLLDNETGMPVGHRLGLILSRGTPVNDSLIELCMRKAECAVDIPRRMPWRPRVVRVVMQPDVLDKGPDRKVLRAFGRIQGVRHGIDLDYLTQQRSERVHLAPIERGSVAVKIGSGEDYTTHFRVGKAELAAAGLRLAVATTLLNPELPEKRVT